MPLAYAARRGAASSSDAAAASPNRSPVAIARAGAGGARRRGTGTGTGGGPSPPLPQSSSRSQSSQASQRSREAPDHDGHGHNSAHPTPASRRRPRGQQRTDAAGNNSVAFRVVLAAMLFFMAATLVLLRMVSTLREDGGAGVAGAPSRRRQDLVDVGRDDDVKQRSHSDPPETRRGERKEDVRRNRDVADRAEKMKERRRRGGDGNGGNVVDNRRRYDKHSSSTGTADVGDKSQWYSRLRDEYDSKILLPESATEERRLLVESLRKQTGHGHGRAYAPIDGTFDNDSEQDCPPHPPPDYPRQWPLMDIIRNWNPDDSGSGPPDGIYQGVCLFDYSKDGDYQKAVNYREAEVPFVLRNHPEVLRTVERWSGHPEYLRRLLRNQPHKTEYSQSNHFMYWKTKHLRGRDMPKGWTPPMENVKMTYPDWIRRANATDEARLEPDREHWYFRLNGCGGDGFVEKGEGEKCNTEFLFDEMPYFKPKESFFIVDPDGHRGINCRFGMRGNIAENHFDGSRNMIALLGGERRYILSHPEQCTNLALFPRDHPSGRHSAVDWSSPHSSLDEYPQFVNATANEVVLLAGDVLYLPEFWFHYIVSLGLNFQCNTRSGRTSTYVKHITKCGF